jgi:prepilin-type N-terminal cleavage/methylation domain-containing protein
LDNLEGIIVRRVAPLDQQGGFTLVEMIVASALLGPAVIAMFLVVERMQGAYNKGERRADVQQSARIAIARIVRDLRSAGLDPSAVIPRLPIQAAIQTAETNRIAFVGDPNSDATTEKIEYRLDLSADPPVLRRQQWSTWNNGWSGTNGAQPLAEWIRSVEFTYFGPGGDVISSSEIGARMGEIRRIGIVIIAEEPSSQVDPETYRLVSEVRMRNVGL